MPYVPEHKKRTRARILECARHLFNRRGFTDVSIDEIMASAGLTRGGFYNHFNTKEDLYAESLLAYAESNMVKSMNDVADENDLAWHIIDQYISRQHLENLDDHCPLMALPSDVARAGPQARAAYQKLLEALVGVFEINLAQTNGASPRQQALAIATTCVGAMVLTRTIDDQELEEEICKAARVSAGAAMGKVPQDA